MIMRGMAACGVVFMLTAWAGPSAAFHGPAALRAPGALSNFPPLPFTFLLPILCLRTVMRCKHVACSSVLPDELAYFSPGRLLSCSLCKCACLSSLLKLACVDAQACAFALPATSSAPRRCWV